MKCAEIGNPDSPHPVRRRSLRIAMAKDEALQTGGQAVSAEDELDEVLLIKRMEKVQEVQRLDRGGLLDGRINTYCNVNEVARQIRAKLNQEELGRFRTSAFGVLLDVLDCPWISGQLLIHLVGNCVQSTDDSGRKDKLKFKILGNEVVLTKGQFHLITDLKMGGHRGIMDNGVGGRFAARYFQSSKSVKRKEITKAFLRFNRDAEGTMPSDALKMSLIYALANTFLGNQPSVNLPMHYLSLVDDIEKFNNYPWGDDVWSELVDHVYRCALCIEKGGSTRPTFGGYMFALQVWAFETFPSLAEAGMCVLDSERVNSIPRCLRWRVYAKFSSSKVSDALFKSGKLHVKDVEPTGDELLLDNVKELFKDKPNTAVKASKKLSLSLSKRVRNVKERQVNIRDAFVRLKTEGKASGSEVKSAVKRDGKGSVKAEHGAVERERKGKKVCVANTDSEQMDMMKEIKEIKEKQDAQDKKLDEILGILRQKTASVEAGSASGKGSLMGGNEEPRVQNEGITVEGNSDAEGKCGVDLDLSCDDGGPSFDLLTPLPRVDAVGAEIRNDKNGNVSVTEACDPVKEWKCPDIPYTETQYDPRFLDLIDRQEEMILKSLQNASSGSSGSNKGKLGQHIDGGKRRRSLDDDDFERIFTSSRVGSGGQGVNDSNTECVEIECPKRVHKNPERDTPTEVEHDKKKRKLGRLERAKQHLNHDSPVVCHGPFSEDPKPANGEIEKHVEIAMHFLEVKGRQYNLLQMYTTTTPYFLQGLYNHQAMVNVGKAKKEEVVTNRNLSRRTIRVYDSKGKKGKSCRALNEYVQCLTELLPVLLDLLSVYDEHSEGPMGKKKFNIEVVDGCPQQDDGCNCGMFMLKFAEYLMMDRKISDVHARDMEGYRVKMTTELMVYSNELKEKAEDK
ncbi:unnamed protein product [Cuscuta campestris]|uniref:Ubiquitin-like protease family profile domain-containing protein n=1 Tax=Cuscuta campestris TaxID=132261 RepID=A0A484K3Q6_9ASTE|nr:unnamed protein product [Cuscuta campestris]